MHRLYQCSFFGNYIQDDLIFACSY